jgi:predicted metal-binding protein
MSNRTKLRRKKAPFCLNCKVKRAEHVVLAPDGMEVYSCAGCWPALAAVLRQFARENSAVLSFCGCGKCGGGGGDLVDQVEDVFGASGVRAASARMAACAGRPEAEAPAGVRTDES